jgi:light-regulated signal transduction histidine kinase (bacteriophytochrome)
MFTLFQRLHSRDEYEGTGLGLAICLKIAELHGGGIRAEGQEGHGAKFYVSLPNLHPVS